MSLPAAEPQRTAPAAAAVELDRVRKTYPNGPVEVEALRSVSLSIPHGAVTAVMGPSGSGKSTFLNCAAGLDSPTSGRVLVGGTDLTALAPDEVTRFRRDRIGFVFQSYDLVPHLTVAENVRLPLLLGGRRPDPEWERFLIAAVGLEGREDRLPGALSGGQAQRVAIARALVARPAVVFADEPTGALDAETGGRVLDVLRGTARDLGQTLVIVTHDARVAAAAERVLFLADGRFVDELAAPSASEITARLTRLGA